MKYNLQKYSSEVANNTISYQWEDVPIGNILRFDTNTLPFPPTCLSDFFTQMKSNCPINEYCDPSYKRLKKLIAIYENVSEDMITLTNSGDEAIDVIAKTFLNPRDYFITTPPTYEMFGIQCGLINGKNLEVPLSKNNFITNEEKIIQESKKNNVKIIFLVNPNNPTASIIPQKTIENIVKNSDAIVVVDEVYREFYGKSAVSFLKQYQNLVILRSLSKFAALAGARIGYLIANKQLSQKFDAIRFPMGISYLSYKLAEYVLDKNKKWMKEQIQLIIKERKRLTTELSKLGLIVYPSFANFLLVKIGESATFISNKLREKGIVIRNRSNKKYLEGCVRITVRSRWENDQLIKTLKEILMDFDGLIFDMDGVIVDVRNSYRETIRQTASFFLKRDVKKEEVDRIKSKIGMNNDWNATYALINDPKIPFNEVKNYFQSIYLGKEKIMGLVQKEKLLISKTQFLKLKKRYIKLGIATGRPRKEAEYVISSNKLDGIFDLVVALEDTPREKPFPDSIIKVIKLLKLNNTVYIGDSPSDVLAAKSSGIPSFFIGKESLGTRKFSKVSAVIKYLLNKKI